MKSRERIIDPRFAQSLVDIIAAELDKNVNIVDGEGIIIASFSPERIGRLHEAAAQHLKDGGPDAFSVSAADEVNWPGVRSGFNVAIRYRGRRAGFIGVTGQPETAAPYARLAARFVTAALEANERQRRLVKTLREKKELQSMLLRQSIRAQEEERRRISRELHDETSQALTSILMGLRLLAEQLPERVMRERVLAMREVAAGTLDSVHRLAVELRPLLLDDMGLAPALQRYADNYGGQYGVTVNLEADSIAGLRFQPEIETAIYRIVQEALTNIAKHAAAKVISIRIVLNNQRLKCQVEDDGCGFSFDILSGSVARPCLGLHGMQERVELLHGHFNISSEEGVGTIVSVEVPARKH